MVNRCPKQAFAAIRQQLEQAGVADAAFDSGCLMEFVVGTNWRWTETPLTQAQWEQLLQMTQKRAERYPLQYLMGNWCFLDFSLQVGQGVLIPRADTEILCETAAKLLQGCSRPQVLDLCAGSGCVGLGIKRLVPQAQVTCLEKSDAAFAYLQKNAGTALPFVNGQEQTVTAVQGDVFYYQNQVQDQSLDLIASNPPYITSREMETLEPELAHEPNMALEAPEDGLAFYQHIAPAYFGALKPGGWLAVEIGCKQAAPVQAIFEQSGYTQIQVIQDYGANDRVVLGKKPQITM